MPWNLILLHSALFFIYVMIYIALLTSSLTTAGKLGPMEMNLWLVTAPVVGFFLFGFTFRRFSHKQFRQLLTAFLGILGVSIATLGLGVTAGAGSLCTGIGLLLFPLGTGYIYGYLHYLMCRWLPSGRRGLCIGLGFALPRSGFRAAEPAPVSGGLAAENYSRPALVPLGSPARGSGIHGNAAAADKNLGP